MSSTPSSLKSSTSEVRKTLLLNITRAWNSLASVSKADPSEVDDFFSFCKKLNPQEFETIIKEGQLLQFHQGSVLYSQGAPSDSFFVINDGTVEILVTDEQGCNPISVAYLSRGDLFGEIGLLTGALRTTSVLVPESATLLRFEKDAFERLMTAVPSFGHYLAKLLARRLHKTTMQLHFQSNARELSGNLEFFDLPTIFQTIFLSQQHGTMHVFNSTSDIMGEFIFENGKPISASYQHLNGMEALFQLFQVTPKANFGFTRTDKPPSVENSIELKNVNEFIMQAVHFRDEMLILEEKLKLSDDQPIKRVHAHLEWTQPDLQPCAKDLWRSLTKNPLTLATISSTLPYCRHHILQVLDHAFETGQLAFAEITPYGYR